VAVVFLRRKLHEIMFKKIALTTTLLITTLLGLDAQTGKIIGKLIDAKTGETLPGATILIEGTTKGASADFDGNYVLTGLQPGKYNLIASYITYDNKKFMDVVVKANDVTEFNIGLRSIEFTNIRRGSCSGRNE
jgi:hypothetical protein